MQDIKVIEILFLSVFILAGAVLTMLFVLTKSVKKGRSDREYVHETKEIIINKIVNFDTEFHKKEQKLRGNYLNLDNQYTKIEKHQRQIKNNMHELSQNLVTSTTILTEINNQLKNMKNKK